MDLNKVGGCGLKSHGSGQRLVVDIFDSGNEHLGP